MILDEQNDEIKDPVNEWMNEWMSFNDGFEMMYPKQRWMVCLLLFPLMVMMMNDIWIASSSKTGKWSKQVMEKCFK